jgi:dihydropteroate synthase
MSLKLNLRDLALPLGRRTIVMGILNVTPDSFYDGGRYADTDAAVRRAFEMVESGADIIDIGGESTRPSAPAVSAEDEARRIRPVVRSLLEDGRVPISIDTRKAGVAREMLELGAHMVNDVSGLSFDEAMIPVVKDHGVPVVIMHMRGTPENMQDFTDYDDVVTDVKRELAQRVTAAERAGIRPESIVIDPGIGFSKTAEQSIELIGRLGEFLDLGKPILLGPSRKSFIGKTLGLEPEDRLEATIASCIVGVSNGAAMVRAHDVRSIVRALRMFERFRRYGPIADSGVPGRWNG